MIGIEDYAFEDKNRWRVMMWSRIASRVRKRKNLADALVLYLSGEQDLDRPVAIKKGFSDHNLIAVDIDRKKVLALRRRGVRAMRADFVSIVANWQYKQGPDVIYGDFCSGLSEWTSRGIVSALGVSRFEENCVLALNFQRGRDRWSNPWRHAVRTNWLPYEDGDVDLSEGVQLIKQMGCMDPTKHRGAQFLLVWWTLEDFAAKDPRVTGRLVDVPRAIRATATLSAVKPEFLTYRGKRVHMDSLVCSLPFSIDRDSPMVKPIKMLDLRSVRQIAACMALRTMRIERLKSAA